MSRGDIPPRWINCPRNGELISDIFIPFKAPLSEAFFSQLPPSSYFTPQMFIAYLKSQRLNVGLWIDLTFTTRYYERKAVTNEGIDYVKIKLRGHKQCPTEDEIHQFIDVCQDFLNKSPQGQIAIHCTHGFNRTGYLICCFLVHVKKWPIEVAITAFAKSRPPGIYKQEYIDELFQKFSQYESSFQAPPLPDWCDEDALYNDDDPEAISRPLRQEEPSGSRTNNSNSSHTTTSSDSNVEGISLVHDSQKVHKVQQMCSRMCNFDRRGFPGCHPVSLTRDNLHMLRDEEYLVSWKADGTRYLLLILSPHEMYFFDRDYKCYQLFNVKFVQKDTNEPLTNTLLDGELVVDIVDGKSLPRYLIYDIIYCDGEDVMNNNFRARLEIIFKQVFMPREKAKKNGLIDRAREPIGIRMKDFIDIQKAYKYFDPKFTNILSHEIDGLIFQPVNMGYSPGRCDRVLKWKPPEHNSVDFKLSIVKENRPGMLEDYIGRLYVGGQDQPFSSIKVTKQLKNYNNKIIECRFNLRKKCWEFMRERTDKSFPNAYTTAANVCNSIQYPVTKEYLLDFIHRNRPVNGNQPSH